MGNPTDAITSKYFIGHHFLLLVKMPSDWYSCSLIGCHVHHVVTKQTEIPSSNKKGHQQTDMCNPTDAIASNNNQSEVA